jgi:F5/8 type C domain
MPIVIKLPSIAGSGVSCVDVPGINRPEVSMIPAYAVLFKCHYWDAFTQRQLERIKRRTGSGEIFVVVDETGGSVQTTGHPEDRVVRISRAIAHDIGLEHFGATPVFWYSNDYPLHIFTRRYPHYQYYVMVEFDVVLTVDLDAVINRLAETGTDFVGEPIRTPLMQWPWRSSCDGWYDIGHIHHWLTCLAIFSNRAAHYLYERRVAAGLRLRSGSVASLPMCEAVIPTELHLGGFRLMRLNELGSTACYDTAPPRPEESLPDLTGEAFIHPVLDAQRFLRNIVACTPDPIALLDPSHPYRALLTGDAFLHALPYIHHTLWRTRDDQGRRRVVAIMRQSTDAAYLRLHGLDGNNLALGKPATQSSNGEWSLRPDEANGAVTGPVSGHFTFHTAAEERPWWTVDLLANQLVGLVRVFNRMDIAWRANVLEVLVSTDGSRWDRAGHHTGGGPFGGADGNPLEIAVNRSVRFVRLEIPRHDILHLDQVQVLRAGFRAVSR